MPYAYLLLAIVFEVLGTAALQASEQFARPKPVMLMAASYVAAFFCLSQALRGLPIGVAYAIWSGLGVVLIALIGLIWFGQRLDNPAIIGLGLIVAGVATINLFSDTVRH